MASHRNLACHSLAQLPLGRRRTRSWPKNINCALGDTHLTPVLYIIYISIVSCLLAGCWARTLCYICVKSHMTANKSALTVSTKTNSLWKRKCCHARVRDFNIIYNRRGVKSSTRQGWVRYGDGRDSAVLARQYTSDITPPFYTLCRCVNSLHTFIW